MLLCFAILQALVLGRIHLFQYATPLLYIYFVLMYRRDMSHWLGLILAFSLGILIDSAANTPGVASASLTLIAFLQPYWLALFMDKETAPDFQPTAKAMGWGKYLTYATVLTLIYHLVFFSLEVFTFYNWVFWLSCIGASFALTMLLIVVIELCRYK